MPTVDPRLGELLGQELRRHGVQVVNDVTIKAIHLAVARTGLRDAEASAAGLDPVTVGSVELDHKAYYPGARQLQLRIIGHRESLANALRAKVEMRCAWWS